MEFAVRYQVAFHPHLSMGMFVSSVTIRLTLTLYPSMAFATVTNIMRKLMETVSKYAVTDTISENCNAMMVIL